MTLGAAQGLPGLLGGAAPVEGQNLAVDQVHQPVLGVAVSQGQRRDVIPLAQVMVHQLGTQAVMIPGIEAQQGLEAGDGPGLRPALHLAEVMAKQEPERRPVFRDLPGEGGLGGGRQGLAQDGRRAGEQGRQEGMSDPAQGGVRVDIEGGDQVVEDVQAVRRLRMVIEKVHPVLHQILIAIPGVGRARGKDELEPEGFGARVDAAPGPFQGGAGQGRPRAPRPFG